MHSVHINTMREMLDHPEPMDISLVTSKGEVQHAYSATCAQKITLRAILERSGLLRFQINNFRESC